MDRGRRCPQSSPFSRGYHQVFVRRPNGDRRSYELAVNLGVPDLGPAFPPNQDVRHDREGGPSLLQPISRRAPSVILGMHAYRARVFSSSAAYQHWHAGHASLASSSRCASWNAARNSKLLAFVRSRFSKQTRQICSLSE